MPKFTISDQRGRQSVIDYLNRLPDNGKQFDVTITVYREKRTIPQNRLYRLWLGLISDELGYSNRDDLHEVFKMMFIGTKKVEVAGIEQSIPISTTSLNTVGFTQFLERLEAWAESELGIILPHPEDAYWTEFEQRFGGLS